jgi:hypothetical protein
MGIQMRVHAHEQVNVVGNARSVFSFDAAPE